MELKEQVYIKPAERFLKEERNAVERTYRSEAEHTIEAPDRVVIQLPRFVSFYDAQLGIQKKVNDEWVYGDTVRESFKDPTFVRRGGEVCGYRVSLPDAGTYRFIWEWKVILSDPSTQLPMPVALNIAGRHPALKAFNIIELGRGRLFDKFDPQWLMYGQYEYAVQLNIPVKFDDNIHIHFDRKLDILLRNSKEDQNTWLNVLPDGATLLVWDKAALDILLAACENSITSGNLDHRVDAEVTALVRPEAFWSPAHE